VHVFRGHPEDVLDRYYNAAHCFDAQVVVRLTADCPLLDPAVIDKTVLHFATGAYDYVSNAAEPTYPDGLDTEVFSFAALQRAQAEARLPSEREHVTAYFTQHPEIFRLGQVQCEADFAHLRWTVDEPEDLEFVRSVFETLGNGVFGMEAVLQLLAEQPALARLNAGFERNEGYAQALAREAAGSPSC
jgi:spore coat polysaccharide biosynthesis protein SpsF